MNQRIIPHISQRMISLFFYAQKYSVEDQVKKDHNTIGFKRAKLIKVKLTFV
jgi:hypothetical protein